MKEKVPNDDAEDLTEEDFGNMMKKLSNKSKDKYQYLLKAGASFKIAIFKLFQQVWKTETKPNKFKETTIIQLYKGKGDMDDLNNHRNIHMKDFLPKAFEIWFK